MPALPIIAISIGDPNGVGVEIILKTFQDKTLFEHCIPVVYANIDFVQKTTAALQDACSFELNGRYA